MDWTWYLFSFEGRINRAKLWFAAFIWFATIYSFMTIFVWIVMGILLATGQHSVSSETMNPWFYLPASPLLVIFVWLFAATAIKRLHDRGRSGWWFALFFVAPVLLAKLSRPDNALPYGALCLGFSLWCFIELFWLRGTKGPNRFGPDPLAPVVSVAPPDTRPSWDQLREVEFVPHSAGPSAGPHVKRWA
jgi:uncharacterized membrane protein YhaH (DUF805 family)